MPILDLAYDLTRADTCLYLDKDGLWKRGAVNYPQATNANDSLGFYFKGTWIPKALTNLWLNSEPSSGGGNVTFVPNPFEGIQLDSGVVLDSGGTVNSDYTGSSITPVVGQRYTFGIVYRSADGQQASVAASGSGVAQLLVRVGGANDANPILHSDTDYGTFRFVVISTECTDATPNSARLRQPSSYVGGVTVTCSGLMLVDGEIADLTLLDYIRTTGSSVARAVTDIRDPDFPLLANLQGYIDVELSASSNVERIFNIGSNNNNRIRITKTPNNFINIAFDIGGVTQWFIQVDTPIITGRYRIGYYVSDGLNILWVNGVEIGRNTSAYSPQGSNLVLGGNITGTSNKLTNGGFFGQFMASGLSESEWLARCNDWGAYGDLAGFQRTP